MMDIVVIMDTPRLSEDFLRQLASHTEGQVILWNYLLGAQASFLEEAGARIPGLICRDDLAAGELKEDTLFLTASVENKDTLLAAFQSGSIPAMPELQPFSILLPLAAADLPAGDAAQYSLLSELLSGCYVETRPYAERLLYVRRSCWQYLLPDTVFTSLPELVELIAADDTKAALLPALCAVYDRPRLQPVRQLPDKLIVLSRLLELRAAVQNGRHTILYAIHADFHPAAQNNVGGTQFHLRDLVRYFRYHYNVLVLSRDRDGLRLTLYEDQTSCSLRLFLPGPALGRQFSAAAYARVYGFLLDFFQVELLHVHHTMDLSLSIYEEAHQRQIPICLTEHDYYYVCPRIKLLCNRQQRDRTGCNECLQLAFGLPKGRDYIAEWQEASERILGKCRIIFAPSAAARDVYAAFFPETASRIEVIEHGVTVPEELPAELAPVQPIEAGHPFRVAFIGGLTREKGSQLILDVLRRPAENIEWHIFGGIDDPELANHQQENLVKYGWYQQDQIVQLLRDNRIDLVCILSLWQETYCYTLTEALMAGVPVLASDLGALGERVQRLQCGWTVPGPLQAADVAARIAGIAAAGTDYEKTLQRVKNLKFKTVAAMNQEYRRNYKNLLADSRPQWGNGSEELWAVCGQLAQEAESLDLLQPAGTAAAPGDAVLRAELERMIHTRGWQLLLRLRQWRDRVKHLFRRKI